MILMISRNDPIRYREIDRTWDYADMVEFALNYLTLRREEDEALKDVKDPWVLAAMVLKLRL